jgi:hypothetical protein
MAIFNGVSDKVSDEVFHEVFHEGWPKLVGHDLAAMGL